MRSTYLWHMTRFIAMPIKLVVHGVFQSIKRAAQLYEKARRRHKRKM